MEQTLDSAVRAAASVSELLRDVAAVREDGGRALALGDSPVRGLFASEIEQLERLGNSCRDWSRVRVVEGFNPRRVRTCEFHGEVVLGRFDESVRLTEAVELITGVSDTTLADCVVGHNALVKGVRLLANYVVGEGAVVADCGRVTCSKGATFGNGAAIPFALEGGGREVDVFAELGVELAAAVARPGANRSQLGAYREAVAKYRARAASDRGVIGAHARVWGVPRLEDVYVGPHAVVNGATAVVDSTLLSEAESPVRVESGSLVRSSLLQWGSRVSGMAIVERSVLGENARAERHAKVADSYLGPNTEVGAGEVSSCLLGPSVGCHHQSLLISTYWPGGRGNVAYGANVGSNHTSRAPDQEFWGGEGMFLGLGVQVKFPCDFSRAPYTVVASAVNLPPQKVTFPFSLVMPLETQHAGLPPGLNVIVPAWVMSDNAYALRRTESKLRARNKARRARFDFAVLRRDTVQLMRDACRRLEEVGAVKEWYTEQDIAGLGKNVLMEADRERAVAAYRFYARFYALTGLHEEVRRLLAQGARDQIDHLLTTPAADECWELRRQILTQDHEITDVADGLAQLTAAFDQIARDVERAKAKDDHRGVRIIDDYAEVHPPAAEDRVVRDTREEAARLRAEVNECLRLLQVRGRGGMLEANPLARAAKGKG